MLPNTKEINKTNQLTLFQTINNHNFTHFKKYILTYHDIPPGEYQHNICNRITPYDHKTYGIGGKKVVFPDTIELHNTKPSNKVFAYVIDLKFINITTIDNGESITIQKIQTQNNDTHIKLYANLLLNKSAVSKAWVATWYNEQKQQLEIHNMNNHYCSGCNKNLLLKDKFDECCVVQYKNAKKAIYDVSYCKNTFHSCLLLHVMCYIFVKHIFIKHIFVTNYIKFYTTI